MSLLDLVSANPTLESLDRLVVGSELYIPRKAKGLVVVLGEGQTLLDLAERFGLSPVELARANGVKNPLALRPGDRVLIPGLQAKTTYERLLAKQEAERRARPSRKGAARRSSGAWRSKGGGSKRPRGGRPRCAR